MISRPLPGRTIEIDPEPKTASNLTRYSDIDWISRLAAYAQPNENVGLVIAGVSRVNKAGAVHGFLSRPLAHARGSVPARELSCCRGALLQTERTSSAY